MVSKWLHVAKTYWIAVVIGAVIAGMLVYMSNQNKTVEELREDIETTDGLVADAKETRSGLDEDFNTKEHQETIEQRSVSAKEIGKEMIAVDDALTSFYKTNEPLPDDEKEREALFTKLDKAKAQNTKLTGASEADHIKTWQLNPKWTLKLESVVTYQDTNRVPIVFSMKTSDGKPAGLIYAIYNVDNHTLGNISRHYTTDGLKDETDVGGI